MQILKELHLLERGDATFYCLQVFRVTKFLNVFISLKSLNLGGRNLGFCVFVGIGEVFSWKLGIRRNESCKFSRILNVYWENVIAVLFSLQANCTNLARVNSRNSKKRQKQRYI